MKLECKLFREITLGKLLSHYQEKNRLIIAVVNRTLLKDLGTLTLTAESKISLL